MTTESSPKLWQKGWVKNLLTVLLFVVIYLSVRPFMQGDVIHGQVPPLKLQSITEQELNLADLKEPVLVHIWATWCPICNVTKSSVESVAEDYRVINIATQSGDDELLLEHARLNDMNPALIVNDEGGELMEKFGAKAVPADFIIAPGGEIAFIEVGFTSEIGLRIRLWLAGMMEPDNQ